MASIYQEPDTIHFVDVRCQVCNKLLFRVRYVLQTPQFFEVESVCPRCKTLETMRVAPIEAALKNGFDS